MAKNWLDGIKKHIENNPSNKDEKPEFVRIMPRVTKEIEPVQQSKN